MAMGRLNRPSIMIYGGTIKVMLPWSLAVLLLILKCAVLQQNVWLA
jgi:hypothetical protein